MKKSLLIIGGLVLAVILFSLHSGRSTPQSGRPEVAALPSPPAPASAIEPSAAPVLSEQVEVAAQSDDSIIDAPIEVTDCGPDALVLLPPWSKAQEREQSQEFQLRHTQAKEQLIASGLHQHLQASALITRTGPKKIELFKQSLKQDPNNVLTLWHAVSTCSEINDKSLCLLSEWESRLSLLDSDNSQVWMRIALNRFRDEQPKEALTALKRAGVSGTSTDYWRERVDLIQSTLASTGLFTQSEESMLGLGNMLSSTTEQVGYSKMCTQQSVKSTEWAEACMAYGELVVKSDMSMETLKAAHKIRYQSLQALGRSEEAIETYDAFEERFEELERRMDDATDEVGRLLSANPEVFARLANLIKEEGQIAGFETLFSFLDRIVFNEDGGGCMPSMSQRIGLE